MKHLLKKISICLLTLSFVVVNPLQSIFADNIELCDQVFRCPSCNGAASLATTHEEWKLKFASPCSHGFANKNDYTLERIVHQNYTCRSCGKTWTGQYTELKNTCSSY